MNKFLSFFLSLTLVFSLVMLSPQATQAAAPDYCNLSLSVSGSSTSNLGNVKVQNGTKSYGACHIQYYHIASPGVNKKVYVDNQLKSQFSRDLTRSEMANIASGVISGGKSVLQSNGNYRVDFFDISLNQTVRVVYYTKVENRVTYKYVVTMFPVGF